MWIPIVIIRSTLSEYFAFAFFFFFFRIIRGIVRRIFLQFRIIVRG